MNKVHCPRCGPPLRRYFITALNHSIISPLCLVWVSAGVPVGFSRGSPVFAPPTDWPVSIYAEIILKGT